MIVIDDWNWRYKIGHDHAARQNILEKIETLNKKEKRIYDNIIDFSDSFVTISSLLDFYVTNPESCIDYIRNNRKFINSKILALSKLLGYSIRNRIFGIKFITKQDKYLFMELLHMACGSRKRVDLSHLFIPIFGKKYESLIKYVTAVPTSKYPKSVPIKSQTFLKEVKHHIAYATGNESIISSFGKFNNVNYQIEVKESPSGYGEWWAKELLGGRVDKLMLYNNDDMCNLLNIETTVHHEVYPGHGHFYETLRQPTLEFFDHGAFCLIEGWATYAEWHAKPSDYTNHLRGRAAMLVQIMTNPNLNTDKKSNLVLATLLESTNSANAMNILTSLFEYPGFYESYILGAFWIEKNIEEGKFASPSDFLNFLGNKKVGDFFALW